ncbi:MAG: hypothetical protein C5B60_02375 [Chloroflexi bacterium]|nr:MAG: hypothetical protein C5B60_02375 [Chloroflexota bacterium]
MLKQFPQCFGAVPNEDALTTTQWIWLQCQCLLDDGVQICPGCSSLEYGAYCTACGTALQAASPMCDDCHRAGPGPYCQGCGRLLMSPVAAAIAEGTYDWAAWAESLQPFLGGLTPQEQRLLQEG